MAFSNLYTGGFGDFMLELELLFFLLPKFWVKELTLTQVCVVCEHLH